MVLPVIYKQINVCEAIQPCVTHLPQNHIYASVNRVSIGSDNGLLPIRRQAIIQTNTGFLSIKPLGTNLNQNTNLFIQEYVAENIVCEMAAILSRGWLVKDNISIYHKPRLTS